MTRSSQPHMVVTPSAFAVGHSTLENPLIVLNVYLAEKPSRLIQITEMIIKIKTNERLATMPGTRTFAHTVLLAPCTHRI